MTDLGGQHGSSTFNCALHSKTKKAFLRFSALGPRLKGPPPPSGPDQALQTKEKSSPANGLFWPKQLHSRWWETENTCSQDSVSPSHPPNGAHTGDSAGLRASRGYSWRPGRRSESTGCQISSGIGSLGEVKFSILYLPGGGDPPVYSWFSFRTLAFEMLPPMCKVRNTPWWWSH